MFSLRPIERYHGSKHQFYGSFFNSFSFYITFVHTTDSKILEAGIDRDTKAMPTNHYYDMSLASDE